MLSSFCKTQKESFEESLIKFDKIRHYTINYYDMSNDAVFGVVKVEAYGFGEIDELQQQ